MVHNNPSISIINLSGSGLNITIESLKLTYGLKKREPTIVVYKKLTLKTKKIKSKGRERDILC